MLKEQKGITLVALVVTIIVLLILAGVTIALVLGQNGIIGKAQTANKSQEEAVVHDDVVSAFAAIQVDNLGNKDTLGTELTKAGLLNSYLNSGTCDNPTAVSGQTGKYETTYRKTSDSSEYKVTIDIDTAKVTVEKQ